MKLLKGALSVLPVVLGNEKTASWFVFNFK